MRRRVRGDPTWRRVRQAQIPIGIAGLAIGVWQAAAGEVLLGVLVSVIALVSAGLAFTGLRSGRP